MKLLISILFLFLNISTYSQGFTDDFEESEDSIEESFGDLATERINKISSNGRIFIITNENQSFTKGDYITVVKNNKLIFRAITARDTNNIAGIKNIKIYSLVLYKDLRVGDEVQIIRGDDSFFKVKKKEVEEPDNKLEGEEDLYDTNIIEDDLEIDENNKRHIKTDNIVSANLGFVEGKDSTGSTTRENQFNASWSFQFDDNIWVEALYGENVIKNFPAGELGTKLMNFTVRAKYTFSGPMFTYFKPYLGFQLISADSPGAGVATEDTNDPDDLQRELELVDSLEQRRVVFGVTVLKRLVPGWFLRADLGNDILNVGFALEF